MTLGDKAIRPLKGQHILNMNDRYGDFLTIKLDCSEHTEPWFNYDLLNILHFIACHEIAMMYKA